MLFGDRGTSVSTVLGAYDITGATQIIGAVANFDGPVTNLGALTIDSGGVLTGTADITTTDPFIWAAGTLAGTGAGANAVITVNGTIDLNGGLPDGTTHVLDHRTLNLTTTTNLSGKSNGFQFSNGAMINNSGNFITSNDGGVNSQQSIFAGVGTGTFNNTGTFQKSTTGNSGLTQFSSGITAINAGLMEVDAGTLKIAGAISGSGQLRIDGALAVLELGGATAEGVTFGANLGTLTLDNPANYTGTINGFTVGDAINLVNTNATIVGFDGTSASSSLASRTAFPTARRCGCSVRSWRKPG